MIPPETHLTLVWFIPSPIGPRLDGLDGWLEAPEVAGPLWDLAHSYAKRPGSNRPAVTARLAFGFP